MSFKGKKLHIVVHVPNVASMTFHSNSDRYSFNFECGCVDRTTRSACYKSPIIGLNGSFAS